jgi:mRNA interferase RelE/StbE
MTWTIELSIPAQKQLRQLDKQQAKRIIKFLHERLLALENPRELGEVLQDPIYKSLWKYRVGDYRILTRIQDDLLTVLVVDIGHRSSIYLKH